MNKKNQNVPLAKIIDYLAPINNKLRMETNPIIKLESMWDLGKLLDHFLKKHSLRLHELLFMIYDPHSTNKTSNITRDLGSYCYRIFKYFRKKEDIRKKLPNLKSYALFREAFPLLSNSNYSGANRKKILHLLNSNIPINEARRIFVDTKQKLRPVKNPRNQKALLYANESKIINKIIVQMKKLYDENKIPPNEKTIENLLGDKKYRIYLSDLLLALSRDSFLNRLNKFSELDVPQSLRGIYRIASGANDDRSRFRRWVLSSSKLLFLAEGILALDNKENYNFYRRKITDKID